MDNNQIAELLTALGGIAEMLGVLKLELKKNGFSDRETLYLCGKYVESLFNQGRKDDGA